MPTPELAKQADAVRADIAKFEADLKTLLNTIGGAVGAAVSGRISEPMRNISAHIEPLLNMLGAAPVRRRPGRPKKAEGDAPKSRRGGRRKKANLTAEAIAGALEQTGGNKTAAAKVLGVSQPTLYKYLGAAAAAQPKTSEKRATTAPKKATRAKSKK